MDAADRRTGFRDQPGSLASGAASLGKWRMPLGTLLHARVGIVMEIRIAFLAALLTLGAHPALAFSCAGEGIGVCHLPTADAIFVATVLSKVSNTPPVGDAPASATPAGGRQTRMVVSSIRPAPGPSLTVKLATNTSSSPTSSKAV